MMSEREFWKLGSRWDWPPNARYTRHSVSDSYRLMNTVETCEPWPAGRKLKLRSSRSTMLEDFPLCAVPLWSAAAVETLRDLVERDGEFVPAEVTCRGEPVTTRYYLFNCVRVVEALDRARMKPFEFETSPRVPGLQLPIGVDPRMDFSVIPKSINACRCVGAWSQLLVSPEVVERLQASKLSGWALMDPEFPPLTRASNLSPHRPDRLGE